MKGFVSAIVILCLIILLSIASRIVLNNLSLRFTKQLEALEVMIEDNNWKEAEKKIEYMTNDFEQYGKYAAFLINIEKIDEIQRDMAIISAYIKYEDISNSIAKANDLYLQFDNIPKNRSFSIQNLF